MADSDDSHGIATDSGVLGMVISGGIGVVIIGYFLVNLLWQIKSTYDPNSSRKTTNKIILWWAAACLTLSFLFCLGALLWRTNVIFSNINFTSNNVICRLTYCVQYTIYGTSKAVLYVLLTYRIEKVFDGSMYAVNNTLYSCLRIIVCLTTIIFSSMILFWMPLTASDTPVLNISLCYGSLDGMFLLFFFCLFLFCYVLFLTVLSNHGKHAHPTMRRNVCSGHKCFFSSFFIHGQIWLFNRCFNYTCCVFGSNWNISI